MGNNEKMEVPHGAAANTWETMIKIEIPHEAVRKRMVPQGGPVIWQTRHNKVKHECASKLHVFSAGEPPCTGHANEYERGLWSQNGLDRFRGCTEARAMESNGADSSPNNLTCYLMDF